MSPARGGRGVFLLEIGTEEIPARMVAGALEALGAAVTGGLQSARAPARETRLYGTPRRLAVLISGLPERQPDEEIEVTGPPVRAAYDASGRPTRAAEGFARAQGVEAAALRRIATPKGECVAVRRVVPGRAIGDLLAERIPPIVASLAFPKTMRWGTGEHRFVRPIHSIVALLDGEVVDMTIAGVQSGRSTSGHRSAGRGPLRLDSASAYVGLLRDHGVLADVVERRRAIADRLLEAARAAGGRIAPPPGARAVPDGVADAELLEEVTHLVEWPLVITGEFDDGFLALPAEILVTAMRHHQKYFSLTGDDGALLNRFLAVANCAADPSGTIRRGHEWVLRARLSDARFFHEEDRKSPLEARRAQLERVTFQEKLGSYARKTERLARLVERLIEPFRAAGSRPDAAAAGRAAALCKIDLTTQMVKEFPELEGIVGGLYAAADGLPRAVSDAIYGHHLPRGAADPLPATPEGAIVSLADRLDTQAGIFLLGIVPTGSRDPYALRRSVQGACRILIERRVRVSLAGLLGAALDGYDRAAVPDAAPRDGTLHGLLEFYRGRQQFLGEEAGLRADSVRAALAADCDDPQDARLRMRALDAFRAEGGFERLVQAHKRIKNILQGAPAGSPDPALLTADAERALHEGLTAARPRVEAARARADYREALAAIDRLREPLDRFFEQVMVMAEDMPVRRNRLALLRELASLFLSVGDFAEFVIEGEPSAAQRPAPAAP